MSLPLRLAEYFRDESAHAPQWLRASGDRGESSSRLDPDPDVELVRRIRDGDPSALEALFRTYFGPLVRFARTHVGTTDDAEEIVAELFATIWAGHAEWMPARAATYLYRAVRNRASNVRRDERRRAAHGESFVAAGELPGSGTLGTTDAWAEQDERTWLLSQAIGKLSERQRTILTLRWEHELGWQGIADVVGISVPAAKSEHTRTLAVLRAFFPQDQR
jgi:RNA polymerase sigma-70 factor (ECF subfamily)